MTEERPKNEAANMGVEDVVRIKQQLNQSITYGSSNLNARQISQLQSMDAAQWAKVRRGYDEGIKGMHVNSLVLFAVAAVGIAVWLYFKNWIGVVGLTCAIYAGAQIFKREGHREGYMDGYDSGFEGCFHRALGISDKEALEIHGKATEMKIDDMNVAAFDKRKPDQ